MFHGDEMNSRLKEMLAGSVKTGDFTLTSGKKSDYYVDIKETYTEPEVMVEIVREMAGIVRGLNVDKIAGIALGAVPIAVALSLELNIPFLVVRKNNKGHGTDVHVEGGLKKGDEVVVVEDVVTTGGSVLGGVREIRKMGTCSTVIAVVDRDEGARNLLKEHDIELIALATAKELSGGK